MFCKISNLHLIYRTFVLIVSTTDTVKSSSRRIYNLQKKLKSLSRLLVCSVDCKTMVTLHHSAPCFNFHFHLSFLSERFRKVCQVISISSLVSNRISSALPKNLNFYTLFLVQLISEYVSEKISEYV